MRTIILAFVVVLGILSCDRDGPPPSDEGKIIGLWGHSFERMRNVDGSFNDSFNDSLRPCKDYYMRFRKDSTLHFRASYQVAPHECSVTPIKGWRAEGRWQRTANEKYRLFLTSTDGRQDSIIEPERIWFSEENFMVIQFDPIIDNGVDRPFYFEIVFFKQED